MYFPNIILHQIISNMRSHIQKEAIPMPNGIERANSSLQSSANASERASEAVRVSRDRQMNTASQVEFTSGSGRTAFLQSSRITASELGSIASMLTNNARVANRSLIREPRPVRLPHPPESAFFGSFSSWKGNSSNIVVNEDEYASICHIIDNIDNNMGACIHHTATEIEEMCQTVFILPSAGPRCLNVSGSMKRCLGQFRMVTEDSLIELRRYIQAIMGVG